MLISKIQVVFFDEEILIFNPTLLSKAYTLHAKQVTFKVYILVFWTLNYVISSQDGTVREDVIARCCTHKSECVISLSVIVVGSFYYYDGIEMAVIIWCWTSGQMAFTLTRGLGTRLAFAWQCMSVYNPPYFHSYCCICIYFSTPINVGTVIVSFIRISGAS